MRHIVPFRTPNKRDSIVHFFQMFPEWFGTEHAVLEKRDMSAETVFEAP
jgi:hypothetical protein